MSQDLPLLAAARQQNAAIRSSYTSTRRQGVSVSPTPGSKQFQRMSGPSQKGQREHPFSSCCQGIIVDISVCRLDGCGVLVHKSYILSYFFTLLFLLSFVTPSLLSLNRSLEMQTRHCHSSLAASYHPAVAEERKLDHPEK